PHLKGAATVLISPDEALAQFPFAALPGSKPGTFLLEEIPLAVVPVPARLTEPPGARPGATPSLLLVGDVDFDTAVSAATRAPARGKGWRRLPGTRQEVEGLGALFRARYPGGKVLDLRGKAATAEALRRQSPSHAYLHLATHGYFDPPQLRSALSARTTRR